MKNKRVIYVVVLALKNEYRVWIRSFFLTFTTFISNYSNFRRIMIIVESIGQLPNRIGSCIFNCLPVSFPFNMIQIVGQYIRLLD